MIKHIILWQLKDELTKEEKDEVCAKIREGLEGLVGQVPGLEAVHVQTEKLPSSNADLMLDSTVTDEKALKEYAAHPAHVKILEGVIRPNIKTRVCIDYRI